MKPRSKIFTNRVDHSSVVLAVWPGAEGGTARTVRYALEKGRELMVVNPNLFRLTPMTKQNGKTRSTHTARSDQSKTPSVIS